MTPTHTLFPKPQFSKTMRANNPGGEVWEFLHPVKIISAAAQAEAARVEQEAALASI